MKRGNTPWRPAPSATLIWHGETPYSGDFEDFYYSSDDGLLESEYVFIQGNSLPARWESHPDAHFCIAETGFGTGLNFLATWRAWCAQPLDRPDLHYIAIDNRPLSAADMRRALAHWDCLQDTATALLEGYPDALPGQHRLLLDGGRVRLDLWWADAVECLADIASRETSVVDAWYLDGFTPTRNADMWTPQLFDSVATLSRPGATLATFTAAGQVRRDLGSVGFQIEKRSGFGLKRECCHGVMQDAALDKAEDILSSTLSNSASLSRGTGTTPWDISELENPRPQQAIVIGAGLAGCHTAAALARRGIAVTVIDEQGVAEAGSANEQGVLYTRLSTQHSPLLDFALQSFQFATHFYSAMLASGQLEAGVDGQLCGTFAQDAKEDELRDMASRLAALPALAQVLSAPQANEKLGVEQAMGGYWYPRSGWLSPPAVCRALLDHPGIKLLEHTAGITLVRKELKWQAQVNNQAIASAACVIVAVGNSTPSIDGLEWIPTRPVRGQTTRVPTSPESQKLKAVLCHKGYIAPQREGSHCIGATFDPGDTSTEERAKDNDANMTALAQAVPALAATLADLSPATLAGRTRFRCASPDYLPMVGAVPNRPGFIDRYQPLKHNARQHLPQSGDYIPGMYITTAHGSRGLTSTPLAAEILASLICHEPAPVSRELSRALSPARFIIRDLVRNRI